MQKLLNVQELAEKLNVPVSWIYDRTRNGSADHIPHYKVGKYIRFSEEEVLSYLQDKCVPDS